MAKVRLLLDEDVDPGLVEPLKERGFDAVAVVRLGMGEADDPEVLRRAADEKRALLTHNVGHFVAHAGEYVKQGLDHSGIIVSDQVPFGELLARILRLLEEKNAADLENKLEWLHNYGGKRTPRGR